MRSSSRLALPASVVIFASLLGLGASPRARADDTSSAISDPAEWREFQSTLERYGDRMKEFQVDARAYLDSQEAEERSKISSTFGAAIQRLDDSEDAMRSVATQRLEAFLVKYPDSKYSADMMFRLADLYFEASELSFFAANDDYQKLASQLEEHPDMVLPPPPLKDYSRPIALYRQIVSKYPDYAFSADTLYMLAYCQSLTNAQQYDPESARDVYLEIVRRFPGSPFTNEANMRLGEYYFDLPGTREAPTGNIPIAVRYYEAVLADGKEGRNYDEAIYKLGWSHYKLNEYEKTLSYLVTLLDYSEEQFLQTGKPSSMRPEAIEYLAISYADIGERQGKRPIDIAFAHLDRVGERAWQHDVIARLADILWVQAKWETSIDAYTAIQARWPDHPLNPVYQQEIALIWAGQNKNDAGEPRPGLPLPDSAKAGAAFATLAENYVDGTRWYKANRGNPDAIAKARGYIETSLAAVATEHLIRCKETNDVVLCAQAATEFEAFLDKFPFANEYNEFEMYWAISLESSKQYVPAERTYRQIVKNERSPFRDPARYKVMVMRREIALAKFGKLEDVPSDATTARVRTTTFGQQVTEYVMSDEQKAFIAAADDLVDRELSDPDAARDLERDRAALAYMPAQMYFNHGYFDEARKRFEKVIQRFPTRNEALYSSNLLIATYQVEGDLAKSIELTEYYATKSLGDAAIAEGIKKTNAGNAEKAAFVLCYQLIEKNDQAGAAQCYVNFMGKYPKSELYKDALLNAANSYQAAGNAAESNRLFEAYLTKYPTDERSKVLYFRIASNYSTTLELPKAIQYYDALVKLDKNYIDSAAALFNASFLRVGQGDHRGAALGFQKYATDYPGQPDAPEVFWRAGEQWELVSEADAVSFYQKYVTRPGADPNHVIESYYRLSKVYEARGDARKRADAWRDIQDTYRRSDIARLSSRARGIAAEGALEGFVKQFEEFKLVKWTKDEAKNVEILTKTKPEQLKSLTDEALRLIQTYVDYDTAAASLHFQGMAFFAYADMAYSIPPPKGLTDEELDEYRRIIDEKFRIGAEDRGKSRLVAALEKAKAEKRWSKWNSLTSEALNERYPSVYPSERQEARGAIGAASVQMSPPMDLPTGEK